MCTRLYIYAKIMFVCLQCIYVLPGKLADKPKDTILFGHKIASFRYQDGTLDRLGWFR